MLTSLALVESSTTRSVRDCGAAFARLAQTPLTGGVSLKWIKKSLDITDGGLVGTCGVAPRSVRIGSVLRHGSRTYLCAVARYLARRLKLIGVRTMESGWSFSMLTIRARPRRATDCADIPRTVTFGLWTLCARASTRFGTNSACVPTTGTT